MLQKNGIENLWFDPISSNLFPYINYGDRYEDRQEVEAIGEGWNNALQVSPALSPIIRGFMNSRGMFGPDKQAMPFGRTGLERIVSRVTAFPIIRDALNSISDVIYIPYTGVQLRGITGPIPLGGGLWRLVFVERDPTKIFDPKQVKFLQREVNELRNNGTLTEPQWVNTSEALVDVLSGKKVDIDAFPGLRIALDKFNLVYGIRAAGSTNSIKASAEKMPSKPFKIRVARSSLSMETN
ncbi:hypothetical protein LCGC14_2379260 [marine sediment metagenome]|uniref:Uncharacterized protein n=1 Tax=marine sediment metagenome TaxID=412755 RepID=A0A0F9CNL9_9ZZZZ